MALRIMSAMTNEKKRAPKVKEDKVALAYEMERRGVKRKRIASDIGVTAETIRTWLQKYQDPGAAA